MERTSFIRMDPPEHDEQRREVKRTVNPITLAKMESLIRDRTNMVLTDCRAARRSTGWSMLDRADLDDAADAVHYPIEDRARLIRWSDTFICDMNAR